ncbi:uncharacterized protein EI90DRAFT_3139371 [Cantharellus anzutake]|uniref:uncharacterized protein n=1 Tax=Cantharellus anzutake TaxID=1750568 RepID=UPI0019077BA2|nr:uncharacterized protein EI90DRAFT_3139371 [Cantharellus anzutake]KAF8310608.1 hypothetical protein EI90DRAFT_3139371 [Cantharellus anzutake]
MAKIILENAIGRACVSLGQFFRSGNDVRSLHYPWTAVYGALNSAGDLEIKEWLRDKSEFDAYVKSNGGQPERELIELVRTTTLAWDSAFKGNPAGVLLETIADFLALERSPYARLTGLVNSSGTGKSRMVDQLGKEIITVPMCLRLWGSQGFPDRTLRNWLLFSETTDWQTVSEKQDIHELSRHDEESARKLCKEKPEDYVPLVIELQKRLASAFREHMTAGQSYYTSNPNREIFYHKVIELTDKVNFLSFSTFDDIAYSASKDTVTIDKVVQIDWISHLGCPLFGSYWDNLPGEHKYESVIMEYVKKKLLDGPTALRNSNPTGTLACLSARFALEFNKNSPADDVGYAQVKRHMRLCIGATAELDKLIGSEPLLAEAAYELMKDMQGNAKMAVSDSDSESESTTEEPKKKKRKLTLEPETVPPKPVIRMVFALACPEPAVVFGERPKGRPRFDLSDNAIAYDIWLAGLSPKTFRQIREEDLESYETLLFTCASCRI